MKPEFIFGSTTTTTQKNKNVYGNVILGYLGALNFSLVIAGI